MYNLKLLDCTLRDGGYINDWRFGYENIRDIVRSLVKAGTDIVEVGFLRNVDYDPDCTRWNTVAELKKILPADRKNVMFSGMALHNFYDIDKLEPWGGTGIDLIRVTFHDYDIEEGLAFCQKAQDKGYKISCNPINIMGYSDAGVLWLCEQVNKLHPFAFSIVDTFGSMQMQDLERIVRLVDNNLAKDIALGLHLHENLAQSFSLAQRFLDMHLVGRDVTVDASLLGMGRTPGNLCIELIADYMNQRIRFIVEKSGFFASSFLVKEGLISADRFLPMFGVTGLAEAVNRLVASRGLVYGRDKEADDLGVAIMERIDREVAGFTAAYSPITGNRFLLHAQVGLDSDVGVTSGVRIPVGSEPESFADHLRHCARFHGFFPAGVGDIFPIASNVEQNPAALLDVVKGAFGLGVHYMSFYSDNTDLVRITGYLVKRSEMEKFRAHQVVLQNTTHLGTANYDTNHLERRKVRMV